MTLLFDEKEINSIFQNGHTQREHDEKLNSTKEMLNRILESNGKLKNVSALQPYDQDLIVSSIMDHLNQITTWLVSSSNQNLELYAKADDFIGTGINYENGKIAEYKTKEIKIILKKDDNANESGYICLTAYPNIGKYAKTATPTGRNLLPDLIQTRTFKKADTQQRTQLVNAVNNGVKPNADPIVRVMDKVYCDIITHPEFNPDSMKILYDFNSIMIQDESNYSYFNLTPNEQQFNGTRKALHSIAQYAYNKRNQYFSKINAQSKPAKPTATPQNNTTHIKRPKSDIPKPAKPQTNPIPQSETIPQNNQNGHVGQPKPNRSKPKMTRGEQAEKTFGANYPKPKPTNDFSL